MPYTEAGLINLVSTALMDTGTAVWGTAHIGNELQQQGRVISRYRPVLAFGTVTFASTAKELVSTTLTSMIGDPVALEYEVNKDPKRYRNFEFRDGTVIPDINFTPTAGATAFIWYNKAHTLSGTTTNTLDPEEERIIIQLTVAELQRQKGGDLINTFPRGGPRSIVDFRETAKERREEAMQDLRAISDSHHHMVQDWPKVQ
ncbi:hypothetical protein LCGC14_1400400 [marine sediment metagenome]|uniref:Uncharacterized protein n=1 Tax=marine sediment metagenome TaxID=412755 RepID=A0A0F9MCT8_9ZZZZ